MKRVGVLFLICILMFSFALAQDVDTTEYGSYDGARCILEEASILGMCHPGRCVGEVRDSSPVGKWHCTDTGRTGGSPTPTPTPTPTATTPTAPTAPTATITPTATSVDPSPVVDRALAAADSAVDRALDRVFSNPNIPESVRQLIRDALDIARSVRSQVREGVSVSSGSINIDLDLSTIIKNALVEADVAIDRALADSQVPDSARQAVSSARAARDQALGNLGGLNDIEINLVRNSALATADSAVDRALSNSNIPESVRQTVRDTRAIRARALSGASTSGGGLGVSTSALSATDTAKFNAVRDDAIAHADLVVDKALSDAGVTEEISQIILDSRVTRDDALDGFNRSRYDFAIAEQRSEVASLASGAKPGIRVFADNRKKLGVEYGVKIAELSDLEVGSDNVLRVRMKNGEDFEVKIMPEVAVERAIERLKLKVCDESTECLIDLKEVGSGKDVRMVYFLKAKKEGRFLGFFKIKMNVESEVDAGTGEVISSKKPWWSFLVKE